MAEYEVHIAWNANRDADDMIVCDSIEAAKELAADARANEAIVVFIAERVAA